MVTIALYLYEYYRLGSKDNLYNLYSLELDNNFYPIKIIKGVEKKEITGAYRAWTCIRARGCDAVYKGKHNGKIVLDVRPSEDVTVLEAKQVDRGVYEAEVEITEIERIWEERKPYLDFPFPEGVSTEIELNLDDLKSY
jgi:hypothetical protein